MVFQGVTTSLVVVLVIIGLVVGTVGGNAEFLHPQQTSLLIAQKQQELQRQNDMAEIQRSLAIQQGRQDLESQARLWQQVETWLGPAILVGLICILLLAIAAAYYLICRAQVHLHATAPTSHSDGAAKNVVGTITPRAPGANQRSRKGQGP